MTAITAFLLAFPALFSIVNPIGAAFIFNEATSGFSSEERVSLSGRVAFYSLLTMVAALWGGAYVLNFFGISLGALRIAGGIVVALRSWEMLMAPERHEERKVAQAAPTGQAAMDMAFFPLTMPFTAGPGTISVAISLGAERPASGLGLVAFFAGATAATVAISALIWAAYRSADRVANLLGSGGRRVVSRMSAFLLLCIGVQIMINGIEDVVAVMMGTRAP